MLQTVRNFENAILGSAAKMHWFPKFLLVATVFGGLGLLLRHHSTDWGWAAGASGLLSLVIGLTAGRRDSNRSVAFCASLVLVFASLLLNILTGVERHSQEAPARAVMAAEQARLQAVKDEANAKLFAVKEQIYNDLASAGLNSHGWGIDSGAKWTKYEEIQVLFNGFEPYEAQVKLKIAGFKGHEGVSFPVMKGKDGIWRAGCWRPGGSWIAFDERVSPVDPLIVDRVLEEGACPPSLPRV